MANPPNEGSSAIPSEVEQYMRRSRNPSGGNSLIDVLTLTKIGRLRLRPGDILVARYDGIASDQLCLRIRDHFARLADHRAIVIDRGLELSVLTKEDIEARAA